MAICRECGKSYYPDEGEGYDGCCDNCVENCMECGCEMSSSDYDMGDGYCTFCQPEDNDEEEDDVDASWL